MSFNSTILLQAEKPWVFQSSNSLKKWKGKLSLLLDKRKKIGIYTLDGQNMKTYRKFHNEISSILQFPNYYGRNFDALNDCLSDLQWLGKDLYILFVENSSLTLTKEHHINPEIDGLTGFIRSLNFVVEEEWSKEIALGEWWDRPPIPFHTIFLTNPEEEEVREEIQNLPEIII